MVNDLGVTYTATSNASPWHSTAGDSWGSSLPGNDGHLFHSGPYHEWCFSHCNRYYPARRDVFRDDKARLAADFDGLEYMSGPGDYDSLLSRTITSAATHFRDKKAMFIQWSRELCLLCALFKLHQRGRRARKFMKASAGSLERQLTSVYAGEFLFRSDQRGDVPGHGVVVWIGARHVLAGASAIGDIVIFTTYLASLYGPIYAISQTWSVIQGAKVSFHRVSEILEVERDLRTAIVFFPTPGQRGDHSGRSLLPIVPDQPF